MSIHNCVLIISDAHAAFCDDGAPQVYFLEEITPEEHHHLIKIQGLNDDEVFDYDTDVCQAWHYVMSALDHVPFTELDIIGLTDAEECKKVHGKWARAEVESLAKINSEHAGNIGPIFLIHFGDC